MALPNWEVGLIVYAPITVNGPVHLREPKGFSLPNPFQSDVRINAVSSGVQVTATAYASNIQNARKVTQVFVGYMLDTLTLNVDLPLFLSYTQSQINRGENFNERRIVTEQEWHNAFQEARLLSLTEPTFLRALGWYRKGLYTEDIMDSFLAYWNAIEIIAAEYHPINDNTKKGLKSQIWESFKLVWGDCGNWPIIAGQTKWIDQSYETRKDIAHGIQPITIDFVENLIEKIPVIRKVAFQFLTTWRASQLNPQVPPELHAQYGY